MIRSKNGKRKVSEMENATATNCRQVIDDCSPADGEYDGVWGGYVVTFWSGERASVTYEARTSIGIRTTSAKVRVTVRGDQISVRLIDG